MSFFDFGFFKYAVSEIWKISDTQALTKFFFDTSRNLMVTAAVGLAAKIGHSAPLEVLYSIALFALGFQISTVAITWLETLVKLPMHNISYIAVFYIVIALPFTLYMNSIVRKTVNSIIGAQSFNKVEQFKPTIRADCTFTFDLNNYACPSETGFAR